MYTSLLTGEFLYTLAIFCVNFVYCVTLLYIDLHSTKAQKQYAMKNHSRAVIKATQMNACMKVTNVQRDIYMPWGVHYTVIRPPDTQIGIPTLLHSWRI